MEKRKPGRPKGSSRYERSGQDEAALRKVADMRATTPGISVSAAIKRVIGADRPADLRRLLDKYRGRGQEMQRAAEQQRQQERMQEELRRVVDFVNGFGAAATTWLASPDGQALMTQISAWEALARGVGESPKMDEFLKAVADADAALGAWGSREMPAVIRKWDEVAQQVAAAYPAVRTTP